MQKIMAKEQNSAGHGSTTRTPGDVENHRWPLQHSCPRPTLPLPITPATVVFSSFSCPSVLSAHSWLNTWGRRAGRQAGKAACVRRLFASCRSVKLVHAVRRARCQVEQHA